MPNGFPVTLTLTAEELRHAEEAAKRLAVPVEVFARNAVLNAIRGIEASPPRHKPHQLTHIHRKLRAQGKTLTVEELKEQGLPLYWSRDWVEDQLERGHSYAEIAINAGGYQVMAVRGYLRKEHGISKFTKKTPEEIEAIRQRVREGATRVEIMQEFGLSEFGAARYFQIEDAAKELELRFIRDAQRVSWPATRQQVAEALFEGDPSRASDWLDVRMARGWVTRVKHGLYALTSNHPGGETPPP